MPNQTFVSHVRSITDSEFQYIKKTPNLNKAGIYFSTPEFKSKSHNFGTHGKHKTSPQSRKKPSCVMNVKEVDIDD